MDTTFDVETFLRSLRATKPPWECPKCQKVYKSYSGMEYHLQNFDHTSLGASGTPNKPASARKSKLKFTKRKKGHRFNRRSPSPSEFFYQTRETLTWAEAQRMVEVESEGRVYRLNIDEKLDIISDSDIEKEEENLTNTKIKKEETLPKSLSTPTKSKTEVVNKNSKYVTSPLNTANHKLAASSNIPSNAKKLPKPSYRQLSNYDSESIDAPSRPSAYYRFIEKTPDDIKDEIEYDMDEEDTVWLEIINESRSKKGLSEVTHDQLELLMDRFEKESYFEQTRNGLDANGSPSSIDEDAVCCVCNDGECQNSNVILFCDMCNLAVHQECYGVPYIPEGQWLCRRCLQSPSCPVDCCLCPNRSGAFKQTDDGRWAHVVCALWVPEVGFGNTVFLEPIDGLKNVPPARWKLTCYLCKQKSCGACIQCHRTNCYVAFHVTCAQQAGLFMKMEVQRKSGRNGVTSSVIQEAYCDSHSPVNSKLRFNGAQADGRPNEVLKKTRKIITERRNEAPQISIPHVPKNKITSISRQVNIQKKTAFIQRLLSYWTLKRQARNGVPLLRRLQSHVHQHRSQDPAKTSEQHQLIEQVKYWHRLRHELERVRLLIELIRKRERLKREIVRISQFMSELKLTPLLLVLRRVLDNLREIDVAEVFAEPVSVKDAPDYYKVIKQPMDFSTMSEKIENHVYKTFQDFEGDFNLMVNNCLHYNSTDTIFHRLGVKMRDNGGEIIRSAKLEVERTGFDCDAGILSSEPPEEEETQASNDKDPELPLNKQLDELLVKLDDAVANKRKTKKIKADIASIRRKIVVDSSVSKRSMSRRYSADDAEATSSMTENEAVLSDVDCSFKVSPKIRPVSFKKTRSRKRLMSAKPFLNNWEPESKKSLLERAISCPTEPNAVDSDRESGLGENLGVGESSAFSQTQSDSSKANGGPRPKSSSSSSSVSRRTAVLFKKKLRRRLSPTTTTNISPAKEDPVPTKTPVPDITSCNAAEARNSDLEAEPSKNIKTDSPSTTPNGFNATYDENVFKDRPALKRHESYTTFQPEVLSPTDCTSSNQRIAAMKKKRSFSCSVAVASHPSSYQSGDAASLGDRMGFSDAELPFEYLRRQSYVSTTEDEYDDEDLPQINPLDLIWAKCRGYPPYPALLIDPQMPRSGFCHNSVPIPSPPVEVLQVGDKRIENGNHRIYLVLFFDTKRTWQWLPRNKLQLLGVNGEIDRVKLSEGRRPGIRRNVEAAYRRALRHRGKVNGEIPDSDDENEPSRSCFNLDSKL